MKGCSMCLLTVVSLLSSEVMNAWSTVFGLTVEGGGLRWWVGMCPNCEHLTGRAFFYMGAVLAV